MTSFFNYHFHDLGRVREVDLLKSPAMSDVHCFSWEKASVRNLCLVFIGAPVGFGRDGFKGSLPQPLEQQVSRWHH